MRDDKIQTDDATGYRPTRRIVFSGLASLGVAVALAGCGSSSDDDSAGSSGGSASSDSSSDTASASPSESSGGGKELAKTSDVPVGGGVILTDQKIVVTQPKEGTFEAFSAVCTHQGFLVGQVKDDVIMCEHHGSQFSGDDGSVKKGPAQKALSKVAITVEGTSILAA